jgi:hypothetical protein
MLGEAMLFESSDISQNTATEVGGAVVAASVASVTMQEVKAFSNTVSYHMLVVFKMPCVALPVH